MNAVLVDQDRLPTLVGPTEKVKSLHVVQPLGGRSGTTLLNDTQSSQQGPCSGSLAH